MSSQSPRRPMAATTTMARRRQHSGGAAVRATRGGEGEDGLGLVNDDGEALIAAMGLRMAAPWDEQDVRDEALVGWAGL